MPEDIPHHHSAVRSLTAKSVGREYRAVMSLAEALAGRDFALILEGDYGGQIYLTVPVEIINCSEQSLHQLLFDIDKLTWEIPEGCGIYFEHAPIGSTISGGMGGALIAPDVWIHTELHELGLAQLIADVVHGKRNELDAPGVDELERRAQAGDAHAQYLLAHISRHVNQVRSLELLRLSAAQGNLGAMSMVYKKNIPQAEKEFWLMELAKRSEIDRRIDAARSQLANAYIKGCFGTIDHARATALLQQVCDARWSGIDALQLGKMYRDGLGVNQNNVTALMWLLLSSVFDMRQYPHWRIVVRRELHPHVIESIAKLKALLSDSEVIQAEQLSKTYFVPKNRTNMGEVP